jgi:hypothetical protein
VQVNGYLHNEEEVRLKTIIWTEMNKEYLEVIHACFLGHNSGVIGLTTQ